MKLSALDAIIKATASGSLKWEKTDADRYKTIGEPAVSIEFHYPQCGGETATGADIAQVSFALTSFTFFNGSEGMDRIQTILRTAFPEWEDHLSAIETKLDKFTQELRKA